jgi:hypothetical protein
MLRTKILFALILILPLTGHAQSSFSITGRVVDGAGRPVEGVEIKLFSDSGVMPHFAESYKDFMADKGEFRSVTTDKDGRFQTTVIENPNKIRLAIGKKDYKGFTISASLAAAHDPLVIHKTIVCKDVKKLAEVNDKEILKNSLIEILASDEFGSPSFVDSDCNTVTELFKINDHLLPALALLPGNPALRPQIAHLAAYFADEDLRSALLAALKSPGYPNPSQGDGSDGHLIGGLISPKSEDEWDLTKDAVTCDKRYAGIDPMVVPVEEASLALSANGSSRALSILKATPTCTRRPAEESYVRLAIRWIEKHPGPIESYSNLQKSIQSSARIFNYSGRPERLRINRVITDQAKEKALVSCNIDAGEDSYSYDLVFKKEAGLWVLKGLWPTGVAFVITGH